VAKDHELKTEALRQGRGCIELPELNAALLSEVADGAMLTARGEVATRESLERERRMVATINEGIEKYEPLGRSREFVVSDRLRPEQKQALLTVLDSRDLAVNLRGAAGTGKTETLKELHRGLTEARRSLVAVAPTTSAVEELQKVGFSQPMTIARLLSDPQQRHELAGQVLIIDEAGMVSSRDMAELLALATSKEARIVFSGDTAQIKSVSEGDALRVLERESNLKSVSLLQVQRQTNAEYKAAVEALRVHPAEGFSKLEAMGAIREVDWRTRSQEVSQAYREASAVPNTKGQTRSVLVVAATHEEINGVTHAIRQDRQRAGELTTSHAFVRHGALNWTEAQKKQAKNYQPGQILEFHKAIKGIAKNEALEVLSANKSAIRARNATGESIRIAPRQVHAFAVFEKQTIDVAAGDKLLLQANWREKSFRATNGELVTVASVENLRIKLEDGRVLPQAYRQFTHGYAVTAHKSQGKTVDFQIIAAERMAQDLFYVSASRGREGLTVITSDSLALQESIGVSGDRQSASELARRSAATPTAEIDDFRLYQAHQQTLQHHKPAQQALQHEATIAHGNHPGIGIGF
jgi:ATP-dependent exoDNAse (exonuclease V) alpha subunit